MMKTRSTGTYNDISSNKRRISGHLLGKDPELKARLSQIQADLGMENTITPGMVPTLACNIENMQNMDKLYDCLLYTSDAADE